MTVFENFKVVNIDELAEWLGKHCLHDTAPWLRWWDEIYCSNCISEIKYNPEIDKDLECGWCELHQNCRYFPELDEVPDIKQIIKMWLESESK